MNVLGCRYLVFVFNFLGDSNDVEMLVIFVDEGLGPRPSSSSHRVIRPLSEKESVLSVSSG